MKTSDLNEDVEQEKEAIEAGEQGEPGGAGGVGGPDRANGPVGTSESSEAPGIENANTEKAETVIDLDSLKAALAKSEDQRKRQAAEFQNFKRRTESEKRQMVVLGKSMVLQQLLDVFDDLNRSVTAAVDASANTKEEARNSFESLKSGVDIAYKKLMDELGKLNVVVIETVGQPFSEEFHEAVMQQPAPDGEEPGTILTEVLRGFTLGDRVLRHAKVIVAS